MLKSEAQKLLVSGNVLFLYGYIGELSNENEVQDNENRDIDFVVQLENLCKIYGQVDVRINSNGGSVRHGSAMIAAIQRHQDRVHTYNDGMCASIAADIWMSAQNRHMAENAMLMIHAPSGACYGTAQDMRKYADTLEDLAQGTIELMATATGQELATIKAAYYDGEDHFLTAKQCIEIGLLTAENANYEAEIKPISDTETVQQYFAESKSRIVAHVETVSKNLIIQLKKEPDMEFDDLMKKAANGELSPEEMARMTQAIDAAKAKADAAKTYTAADIEAAKLEATKAQADAVKALEVEIEKLRKGTGTMPITRGLGDGTTADDMPLPNGEMTDAEKSLLEVNRLIAGGARYDLD